MNHTNEFRQALTRLTLRNDAIFFIALLYTMKHECTPGFPAPAATDGSTIIYNPDTFGAYSLADRQFILVHEILHVILFHTLRRGARTVMVRDQHGNEHSLWNIACDYVVNGLAQEYGWTVPKEGIQPDPKFVGLSAEQVYDLLLKECKSAGKPAGKPQAGEGEGEGEGEGDGDGDGARVLPGRDISKSTEDVMDHDPNKPGPNEGKSKADMEREIGINTEKAMQSAKAAGQLSQKMKDTLAAAQVDKEPWFNHLRRYMTVLCAREYNWSRINARRLVACNIFSPDMRTEAMGSIVVSIDESGSLLNSQLAAISAHVADMARECNPKSVIIIRHTDSIEHVETFEAPYNFQLERKSTGGTDFRPVFDYVEAECADVQVILMFTDMMGPMPSNFSVDTIWVTSEKHMKAPFGEIINADFND